MEVRSFVAIGYIEEVECREAHVHTGKIAVRRNYRDETYEVPFLDGVDKEGREVLLVGGQEG